MRTCLILCLLLISSTASPQDQFPFAGVIDGDRVNIRGGGGKNYVILNTVNKGEKIEVYGLGGAKKEWFKCKYPKPLLAYITTRYVKKVSEDQGVLEAQRVHLRPEPSVKRYPIDTLKIGTGLRITGEKNGFYEVVIPESTFVWVHRDHVRKLGPLDKFAKQLKEIRKQALLAFNKKSGKEPTEKPVVPKKDPKEPGKVVPPGTDKKPDLDEAARKDKLVRLEALRKRFETEKVKKNIPGLKTVLADLNRLEVEASKLTDDMSKFMVSYKVNRLVTKVRLALLEVDKIVNPKVRAKDFPRPEPGSVISQTGWLKKENRLLTNRVMYKLEKGNIVLYYLSTKKYDLSRFINKHVNVVGKILVRKSALDNDTLEVTRLKVLSQ